MKQFSWKWGSSNCWQKTNAGKSTEKNIKNSLYFWCLQTHAVRIIAPASTTWAEQWHLTLFGRETFSHWFVFIDCNTRASFHFKDFYFIRCLIRRCLFFTCHPNVSLLLEVFFERQYPFFLPPDFVDCMRRLWKDAKRLVASLALFLKGTFEGCHD